MHSSVGPTIALPTGTITFLFTDVEGSTRLLNAHPEAYKRAVARHHDLLKGAVEAHAGAVFETVGDAVYAAFSQPQDAVAAALDGQLTLHREDWGETPIKVRIGLHTGTAELKDGHYFGAPLYRCARLMSAAHGGQIVLSAATVELVRDSLPPGAALKDLGEHRLKDLARPERVAQLAHPHLASEFPALRTLDTLPNNLPRQLTSFVGREKELSEVTRLLGTTQLLTLTGAGGTGKTRLSLQAAADALEDYAGGVFLVELAPIGDAEQVPAAVAGALGLREEEGRPIRATLTDALKTKHLLLVLDNCEHLIAACAALADPLLRACPKIQILATSREGLGIAGETTWRVPSLSLPSPHHLPPVATLTQYEAVRLFIDRAKAAVPHFEVTDHNAPAVAQICHRLDGIPLAIELAAARIKVLPPEQLLGRLEDRFRLLTGGSRTALPRQQTLQALVDWSHQLLDSQEKALFRRLAVFAGGWTLEAAEAVCADSATDGAASAVAERVEQWEILNFLTRLVDKSLVVADDQPDGTARYRLLETLRQYARQKLLDSSEAEAVHERHAQHVLAFAEQAEHEVWRAHQARWLALCEAEHENIRAALRWWQDAGYAAGGLALTVRLWGFWDIHGHWTERDDWLHVFHEMAERGPADAVPTALRAAGLARSVGAALRRGERDRALALAELSRALWEQLGDEYGLADALFRLSNVHSQTPELSQALREEALATARRGGNDRVIFDALHWLGHGHERDGQDQEKAVRCFEEALAHARTRGGPRDVATILDDLGSIARRNGDFARSRALAEESLTIRQELGDQWGIATSLWRYTDLAIEEGDLDEARRRCEQAMAAWQRLGADEGVGSTLHRFGRIALRYGDLAAADQLLSDAVRLFRERGILLPLPMVIRHFVEIAATRGEAARALRLAGAAGPPRIEAHRLVSDAAAFEDAVATARAALSPEEAGAAWAEGEAMSREELTAYALREIREPARV